MPYKEVGLGDTLTTPTRKYSTQPLEETHLFNNLISREGVVNVPHVKLVERCILGDVVSDSLIVTHAVAQGISLRIEEPLSTTQLVRIAQGDNRILRQHVCMP
jgi:hypothetical protein